MKKKKWAQHMLVDKIVLGSLRKLESQCVGRWAYVYSTGGKKCGHLPLPVGAQELSNGEIHLIGFLEPLDLPELAVIPNK